MGEPKAATAAPKKKARAKVTVVRDDNDEPLREATVEIWSQAKGKTNAKGFYLSHMFFRGSYDLKVSLAGFCPPQVNPRKEFPHIKQETFEDINSKQPHTAITVRLAQALPRAHVTVVDPSRGNAPVPGAEVEIVGKREALTDQKGIYFTSPFAKGTYHVKVRKPGYGPPNASPPKEGEIDEVHSFETAVDKKLTMKIASLWGRVKTSKTTVAGKHFVDWFNDDFRGRMPKKFPGDSTQLAFPGKVVKPNYITVFDNLPGLYAPGELTLEEFVALFLVIYNETGGSFAPLSEKGTPQYMFEPKKGVKVSYNQGGNRMAGDLLLERGKITTEEERALWNGQTWPAPPEGSDLHNAALECDFWKFRGRGLVQLTFRTAYLKFADPALTGAGHPKSDDLAEAELGQIILTDSKVYLGMVKAYLVAVHGHFLEVNRYDWREFGLTVAGRHAHKYAALYEWRCNQLFQEMRKDGFVLQ